MAKMLFRLPQAKRVIENPTPEEVKALAAKMPTARPTRYGNLNVQTKVLARSKGSTSRTTTVTSIGAPSRRTAMPSRSPRPPKGRRSSTRSSPRTGRT